MLDIGVYALSCMRWFMSSKPDRIVSQVKAAPTGVDEQAGILLTNPDGQMAAITLSLHAKQPKRGTIVFENGYVEIFDYPRGERATIYDTSGKPVRTVEAGETANALAYEVADMERAIAAHEAGDAAKVEDLMHLGYTRDVMSMMTEIRRDQWHMTYPEEE